MTDINAPVSAPAFSDHSHYPIGHAPVAASVLTPIPVAERGPKTATVEVAEIAEPTGTEPAAETGQEPAKDAADRKGANGDAADGKPSDDQEEPPLSAHSATAPVAAPAVASSASTAAAEAAAPALPVLAAAKDDVPKAVLTSTGDAAPAATTTASATPATAEAVVGDKRKADAGEQQDEKKVDLPISEASTTDENGGSAAKKAKTEAATEAATETKATTAEAAPAANGSTTNIVDAKKSNGRAKREKKPVPVVGRTARKTRSQGPVDA